MTSLPLDKDSSLNGIVQIDTSDVDPSRGLVQLPTNLFDASSQIDASCNPGSRQAASSFTITGRGGLPPNPRTEPLTGNAIQVDWVSPKPNTGNLNHKSSTTTKKLTPTRVPILPATGWVFNGKGEVTLISSTPNTSALGLTSSSCPKR